MADRFTALQTFWSGFGIPAYDENTVPDDAPFPYITYSVAVSDFDEILNLSASLWYLSTSWSGISQKAEEISASIGGGSGAPYDGGRLWITKASPFAQRMAEPSDDKVRRIVLQVIAEYQ